MHINKAKILLSLLLLFFIGISTAAGYSTARSRLGLATGFHNWALIYRPGNWDFKGAYDFTEGKEYVYLSGDYRFVNQQTITGPLHFSLGAGAYAQVMFGDDHEENIIGGFHIPVSLSLLFFDDFLEFFVEAAPEFDLYPKPALSDDPVQLWAGITLAIE